VACGVVTDRSVSRAGPGRAGAGRRRVGCPVRGRWEGFRPSVRRAAGQAHVTYSRTWPAPHAAGRAASLIFFRSFIRQMSPRSSTLLVFHVVGQYRSVSRLRRPSFVVEMIADNLLSSSRRRAERQSRSTDHLSLFSYQVGYRRS